MDKPLAILIIEDVEFDFLVIEHHLQQQGLAAHCFRVTSGEEVSDALESAAWDVVLSDFNVFGLNFQDSLAIIRERCPELPIILVSGILNEAMAVELLKGGVADFVLKDNLTRLVSAIRRAISEATERIARQAAQTALQKNQAQLQAIVDNINEGIVTSSLDAELLYLNRAAIEIHGYANLEECQGNLKQFTDIYELATPMGEVVPFDQWPIPRILRGETLRDLELQLTRLDQGWQRLCNFSGSLVHDSNGAPLLALLCIRDITDRKAQEEARHLATMLFTNIQDGAVVTDRDGAIVAVNPAFTAITGYSEAEILGENMRFLHSGRHDASFYQQMWHAIHTAGVWQGEIWNRRKNGELYLERLAINAVQNQHGKVTNYVGTFTDITCLKHAHQMEYLAHHDVLTGLPNRLQLLSRLEHALEIARRRHSQGALLFFDLDEFKVVNDTWGHLLGDELLQQLAKRLIARLRDMDTVARLGGDEFVAVIEDIGGQESAATVATQLVQIINKPFSLSGGQAAHIGCSIGIALFPSDGDSAESLLRHADAALYRAKREGKNTYRFHGK